MKHRSNLFVALLVCFSSALLNVGLVSSAYAGQNSTKAGHNANPNQIHGKVTDIIDVTGYTYAEIDTGKKKVWAAGPTTPLKKGDKISFATGMPMENYHSKTLKRKFSILYFVDYFDTGKNSPTSKTAGIAAPHSQIEMDQKSAPVKGIKKVKGGNTISEIYANQSKFSGKTIQVRGKVTKFSPEIMGKNWLHIRDSSTLEDLTVTTDSKVAIGDVVVIKGKLELKKDYGYGYVYPVILVDAKITKE